VLISDDSLKSRGQERNFRIIYESEGVRVKQPPLGVRENITANEKDAK
jgi:hypothetical protein